MASSKKFVVDADVSCAGVCEPRLLPEKGEGVLVRVDVDSKKQPGNGGPSAFRISSGVPQLAMLPNWIGDWEQSCRASFVSQ